MNKHFHAVILAGGKGERFWPLSTAGRPKQFLTLVGSKPLLTLAFERLRGLVPPDRTYVITNKDLMASTRRALPRLPARNIIGEPVGRDTAAALAVGCALVGARDPDGVFCVLTADHIIGHLPRFRRTLRAGLELAGRENVLITIGIEPRGPSTGYGYIEAPERCAARGGIRFRNVRRFVEKPDRATARRYCASGRFFWNSGMFIWSARALERAFARHRPPLARLVAELRPLAGTPRFGAALRRLYAGLERISIDYAVMEKVRNIAMAEGAFAWDDLGSWSALEGHVPADAAGNVVLGSCEAVASEDNVVVSQDRLTALIGVRDLIVVQAPGVTLVCPKDRAQDVKKLVERLRAGGRHAGVL